jgi:acrylyl-CoA reductase (NADPH)
VAPAPGAGLLGVTLTFILRGVSLLGIDFVRTSPALRRAAWDRLARDLDSTHLEAVTRIVSLDQAKAAAAPLDGHGIDRTVVAVAP